MQSFMLSSKSAQFLEYMDLRTRTIWAYLKYASSYSRCKNLGPIFNASLVIMNFVWKFPNFCCHGNRGSLTQISLTQLNRPTPKTPYLAQESWWYLLYKLSNGRFRVQMTSACRHDNKGDLTKIWMIPFDCSTPKTPCLVQIYCTYL